MPRKKIINRLVLRSFLIFFIAVLAILATMMLRIMYVKEDNGIGAVAGGVSELALTGVVLGLLIMAVVKLMGLRNRGR
jgi:magnesium-transporting ATPase (P-type)